MARARPKKIQDPGIEGLHIGIVVQAITDYVRSARYVREHVKEKRDRLNFEHEQKKNAKDLS